ncbi:MAG: glycosyltransferase family 4 protein [Rubrobacteraceae bacterium]
MRILFTAHQFFPEHYAGTEILTLGLVRELKARGHEPFVLAPRRSVPITDIRPGEIVDYEFEGIPVRRVGRPEESAEPPYELDYQNDVMARRAREYALEIEPDVVHAMHFQGLSASVIPVFEELGLPLVYTATDFWAVCPVVDLRRHDGAMCEGPELSHCVRCVASRYPNSRMARAMKWVPDAVIGAAGRRSGSLLSSLLRQPRAVGAIEERPGHLREKIGRVDRVIAPTRLMRDMLVSNGVGTEDTVEVSNYGIDTSHMAGGPPNTNVPPPLRIGYMGSMAPHKGCDTLIEAFKKLPPELDASLAIHGNLERFRPFVNKLRRLAAGDERIDFAGPFQREQVGRVFSETDVLVVPSRWYENAPVVIYESFAAGVPVIATDLGGMSEVVEHGENGLLFELDDAEDLARQLRRLAEEPGLIEKLRADIPPVKTVQQSADELEELYGSLLAKKEKA